VDWVKEKKKFLEKGEFGKNKTASVGSAVKTHAIGGHPGGLACYGDKREGTQREGPVRVKFLAAPGIIGKNKNKKTKILICNAQNWCGGQGKKTRWVESL